MAKWKKKYARLEKTELNYEATDLTRIQDKLAANYTDHSLCITPSIHYHYSIQPNGDEVKIQQVNERAQLHFIQSDADTKKAHQWLTP